MPEGPWQGVSWEGACTFQWEGPVPWLLPGLRPPIWCRRHRTTFTGRAEQHEAQPGAFLLFVLQSSCSSSWTNVGKWRPLGQPQFPANSKHTSTLCASSHAFPQAPENNPTQINHHHGLTPNPLVLFSFIVFSTLWALCTPIEHWIIQTERAGVGKSVDIKWVEERERHRHGRWDVHREIRKKRWVFVHVLVCLSGREREEERKKLYVCIDAYLWVWLHTCYLFMSCIFMYVYSMCVQRGMFIGSELLQKMHWDLQHFPEDCWQH